MREGSGNGDFDDLTPDAVIRSVEEASGRRFLPIAQPLPSYINRVYELRDEDDKRFVVKFYRPGRWSEEAVREEHGFMEDCGGMDIPLALPEILENGDTLDRTEEGILFALFPHMSGRLWEFREDDEQWYRMGRLIGRMHNAGVQDKASHRPRIHPDHSFRRDCHDILEKNWIPPAQAGRFDRVARDISDLITPLFRDVRTQRIHGDFHCGNILDRMDQGLMIIDFDDMAVGPAVQDFWLLLPGHASACRNEFFLLMDGYSDFRPADFSSLSLVEPLRAMRMVYFLAWCGRQREDFSFRRHYPDWGSELFWENEIRDLENQLQEIRDFLDGNES